MEGVGIELLLFTFTIQILANVSFRLGTSF